MILKRVCVGEMEVNCYIIASREGSSAIIIDPGAEGHKIRRLLEEYNLKPALIINTHGHYDHIGCDDEFGVPVYAHSLEIELLRDSRLNLSASFSSGYQVKSEIKELKDKQIIALGDISLEVMHMPGHSPGGIALFMRSSGEKIVFTGDSLFRCSIGRADLPGADEEALLSAIKKKLMALPDDTFVYPGHGPSSTIGEERRSNPFLS